MADVTTLPLPYTVVLRRGYRFGDIPDWDTDPEYDTYTAYVRATDFAEAVRLAKAEVLKYDKRDLTARLGTKYVRALELDRDDYHFLMLFEGHQHVKCFGWESGPWQHE